MTLAQLAAAGTETLVGMAIDGTLSPSVVWTALRGAAKYRKAVADGDIADDETAASRASICSSCPHVQYEPSSIHGVERGWCGRPFVDLTIKGGPCGCLVATRSGGVVYPGAKVSVGSERCPIGRW